MSVYGYARVSAVDQDLSLQEAALRAAGCEVIRTEKKSGSSREGRAELETLLQFMRAGDTLASRSPARSIGDLQDVVRALKAKGAALRATEQPIDTSTAAGKAFLDMQGRVRRVRDQPAPGASDGGDRRGQGAGRLQG